MLTLPINIDLILKEISQLKFDDRIGLQGRHPGADPYAELGNITETPFKDKDYIYPLFDLPYTNSIIEHFKITRTRIMKLKPKTCYSYHVDISKRLHVPLITNDKCFFIIEKEVFQYPADGSFYIIDTTKKHTAVNASFEDRIHLVGSLMPENE